MDIHLVFGQHTERGIRLGHDSNLDLGRLEVNGQHGRQTGNRQLHSFLLAELRLLLQFLLQIAVGLRLLDAYRDRLETAIVTSRIRFVHASPLLIVVRDQHHAAAQRTHLGVLRVHLVDVGNAPAQHIDGDLGAELVQPVGRFVTSALHLGTTVG